MAGNGTGAAWGSVVAGAGSIATLPVAIYLTRYSERYDLIQGSFAIPLAGALGVVAIMLGARAKRRSAVRLGSGSAGGVASAGRMLGIIGVCLAMAGVVALAVYGLLEYAGSRD